MKRLFILLLLSTVVITAGCPQNAPNLDVRNDDYKQLLSVGEFLADLIQIGGSTAVGIVNGERAIQVIGVALTGFSAGRKSADLNFYDEKTTSILIKRMDASRSVVMGEIRQSQQKPTAEYSFDQALDDVVRYFDAGTLNRAFTELDKQTSLSAETARLGVLKIEKLDDVNEIVTIEQAKTIDDLDDKLTALKADLDLPDTTVENKKKIADASAFLQRVYLKLKAKEEFSLILADLQEIGAGTVQDKRLTATRVKALTEAFDKITNNQDLSGRDYYALVSETQVKAFKKNLSDKLLTVFNEVNNQTEQ
jgi:hypothetical protein